jgi:hypothetical protein
MIRAVGILLPRGGRRGRAMAFKRFVIAEVDLPRGRLPGSTSRIVTASFAHPLRRSAR